MAPFLAHALYALWACTGNTPNIEVDDVEFGEQVTAPGHTGDAAETGDTAPPGPSDCGNGVLESGEDCDDGGEWGGDGCSKDCLSEAGTPEVEPNDTFDVATAAAPGVWLDGSLPEQDVDCWAIMVPACGAVAAQQTGDCAVPLGLSLLDPSGNVLAAGSWDDSGCAVLDPVAEPGARFVSEGTWSVCVSAVNEAEVRGYELALTTPDAATLGAPSTGDDSDADTIPDSCDADLDGDGLDNDLDNCPEIPNGPLDSGTAMTGDGFLTQWLSAGAFTTGTTTGECRPSDDFLVGEDSTIAPSLGATAGDLVWTALLFDYYAYDLLTPYGSTPAPREAYVVTYLRSDAARTLTLAVGADDGLFAWWNGTKVLDVSSCQGVNYDQFQAPVDVDAGWNTVMLKVRDWGGGWGFSARLLDDAGAPVTDLQASIRPGESYAPDQTDQDADGIGDICDSEPLGG